MTYLEIIELRAAEARAEIKAMARAALEEIYGRQFVNRSIGQKRRYARQRQESGRE